MPTAPTLPLLYTYEKDITQTLDTIDDLGVALEFVDDFDPEYVCRDAAGKRVRVIVWDLELLALQVVPDDFDASGIEIRQWADPDGTTVWVEYFAGEALRSVVKASGNRTVAQPETWHGDVAVPSSDGGTGSSMSPAEFNVLWMKAKGVKRPS